MMLLKYPTLGGILPENNTQYADNDHEWTTNNALLFKWWTSIQAIQS
jgi:hypothetical protein